MDYNNITIKQIEYFLAVAKYLNYTKASQELFIAQSTLSKQIALLEGNIDVQLFVRDRRSVKLTPAGKILKEKFSLVLDDMGSAIESARYVDKSFNSVLRIGCLTGLDSNRFSIKATEYFKEIYPEAMICYEKHNFQELRGLLSENKLDLILTLSYDVENFENLEFREVCKLSSCIIMSKKNPLAKRKQLTLKDFKNESFVILSREASKGVYDSVMELCKEYGFDPKIDNFLPNIESVIMCVEANMGIAIVDENLMLGENSDIIKVPIENRYASVLAAWSKGNENRALKLYVDTLL